MRVLGVDPGLSGALALLDGNGNLIDLMDMPILRVRRGSSDKGEVNGYALTAKLKQWPAPDTAVIEAVGGITGQSASAAFNFGRGAGIVEGVIKALGMPTEFVNPKAWRAVIRHRKGKDESRAIATRMWPTFAAKFERVKDDGRAEAALIARAWWQKHGGMGNVFG